MRATARSGAVSENCLAAKGTKVNQRTLKLLRCPSWFAGSCGLGLTASAPAPESAPELSILLPLSQERPWQRRRWRAYGRDWLHSLEDRVRVPAHTDLRPIFWPSRDRDSGYRCPGRERFVLRPGSVPHPLNIRGSACCPYHRYCGTG